eukprot:scaffold12244_cov216-Isochrysis_galbana.AAC.1
MRSIPRRLRLGDGSCDLQGTANDGASQGAGACGRSATSTPTAAANLSAHPPFRLHPRAFQVGINGFGRIGRLSFRYLEAMRDDVEVVHINEIMGGSETAAYLVRPSAPTPRCGALAPRCRLRAWFAACDWHRGVDAPARVSRSTAADASGAPNPPAQVKYDSVHGIWGHEVEATSATEIRVDSRTVSFSEHKALTEVPWAEKGVEIVIDCTGVFLKTSVLQPYLDVCGVKRVIVSAPVKEASVRRAGRSRVWACGVGALPPFAMYHSPSGINPLTTPSTRSTRLWASTPHTPRHRPSRLLPLPPAPP